MSSLLIKHNNRCDLIMCILSMIMYIPHGRHRTVSSILMGCPKDMHSPLYCTAPKWVPIWGPGSPWGPFSVFGSPKGPHFLSRSPFSLFQAEERAKSQSIHYYPCHLHIKGWIFRDTSIQWKWHKPVYQMKPHSVKMFFHNSSPLYFKKLACFDQS